METVLVIGAARSGTAAARLLKQQGYDVILTDSGPVQDRTGLEGIQVVDNGHPDWLFEKTYAFAVKNPGIPYRVPVIRRLQEMGVPVYTEIETAYRAADGLRYAAITGTDGKTTVTTLLYEMLRRKNPAARYAGNIGVPLSEVVLETAGEEADIALELSNFQLLGTETFRPEVSVITNLAPDHLDYMDSLDSYYASKMKIYANCREGDWFIRNTDDPEIMKYAVSIPCRIVDFSLTHPADLCRHDGSAWLFGEELFREEDLKIVGDFNLGNAMMAAAMAFKLGVSLEDIRDVICTFPGVEHRIEFVAEHNGIRIYNDTKATNTHAACAALSAFDDNVILLAGGKDKHISFEDLRQYDPIVRHCFSFGQTRDKFKDIFSHQTSVETMEQALEEALRIARPGDTILLSPACSSFDQFSNYEERGRIFKELVRQRLQ